MAGKGYGNSLSMLDWDLEKQAGRKFRFPGGVAGAGTHDLVCARKVSQKNKKSNSLGSMVKNGKFATWSRLKRNTNR